jgi:hypothetical protein
MNLIKNGTLFLLIILISVLILCPILGGACNREGYTNAATKYETDVVKLESGVTDASNNDNDNDNNNDNYKKYYNYDNYDHYSRASAPTIYYGPNGSKANVSNNDGDFSIVVTGSNGQTTTYIPKLPQFNETTTTRKDESNNVISLMKAFSNTTFYGPNGGSARFFTGDDGEYAIEVTKSNGDTIIYTATNTYTYNYNYNYDKKTPESSYTATPFAQGNNTNSKSKSKSMSSSNSPINNSVYNNTLPKGVSKNMIPPGDEDLYILKSEVIPPVCPACPTSSACPRTEKCPPCPACARCPEPMFDCKKVLNYKLNENRSSSGNNNGNGYNNYDSHMKKYKYGNQYGNQYGYDNNRHMNQYKYGNQYGYNNNSNNYHQHNYRDSYGNYQPTNNFNSTGSPGYLPVPVLSDFSTFGM